MKQYFVYIITNSKRGTLYIGVTNDLIQRVWSHKEKLVEGFSKKYELNKLVYYETHTEIEEALLREKQIKKWYRKWKIKLIEEQNPSWEDLFLSLT